MRICHVNPIPIMELVLVSEKFLGEGKFLQNYRLTSGNGQINTQDRVLQLFRASTNVSTDRSPFMAYTWETQRVTVPAVALSDTGEIVDEHPINPVTGQPYGPTVITYIVIRFSIEISRG